jgi:hypothetical protein
MARGALDQAPFFFGLHKEKARVTQMGSDKGRETAADRLARAARNDADQHFTPEKHL